MHKSRSGDLLPNGDWFDRSPLEVARDLLDCNLCRENPDGIHKWRITETEAYDGPEDLACHARVGRTPRTEVMYGKSGVWYVYLCYGMHWLLNIVTGPLNYPAAVLIRGAGEINGPGRLTKALNISKIENTLPATPETKLWIEFAETPNTGKIITTPRIGVDYAGPDWSQRPYRFLRLQPQTE